MRGFPFFKYMNEFVITAKNNPKIKEIKSLTASSRDRKKAELFVTEGVRLCLDAVLTGCTADSVFCTEECFEKNFDIVERIKAAANSFYFVSPEVMKSISDTVTPQGIVCAVKFCENDFKLVAGGKYIALDTVQNPDNLGAAARTAEALGIDGIIVSGGCDIYNPKALRASMGALFRLPVKTVAGLEEVVSDCCEKNIPVYATVPDREALSVTEADFSHGAVCVIGNEGAGVKKSVIDICSKCVTIKMSGRAESLNAASAASIIMWEMVK